MPKLKSGSYLTKVEREVVIWPAPDANGTGEPLWIAEKDELGREIGRMLAKDANGKEVRAYFPPEGFKDRPSSDGTSNVVKVDGYGNVVRQPNGEAINIKPGQALVFNPDGSVEVLPDEYAQYVFQQAHDAVNGSVEEDEDVAEEETREQQLERELAELRAERA